MSEQADRTSEYRVSSPSRTLAYARIRPAAGGQWMVTYGGEAHAAIAGTEAVSAPARLPKTVTFRDEGSAERAAEGFAMQVAHNQRALDRELFCLNRLLYDYADEAGEITVSHWRGGSRDSSD